MLNKNTHYQSSKSKGTNMYSLIFITSYKNFSLAIKEYFYKKNNVKNEIIFFDCFGIDEDSEESIYNFLLKKRINSVEKIIIFSDLGNSYEMAKKLVKKNPDIFHLADGSLIESGFLSYLMLNTSAPIESINKFIDNPVGKKEVK
ncbi:MAG: hypothetical protein ACRCRP_01440 [Metamycoplasmataceae bacterium]